MASGCLMGVCPACDELIWEDQWDMLNDTIIHESCRKAFLQKKLGMSEEQFLRLCGSDELRQETEATKTAMKDSMEFFTEKLLSLQKKLDDLVKAKE